ncbi:hypothetical protein QP173_09235, partial [Aerococcus urinae]
ELRIGQKMTFAITYTNHSKRNITAFPYQSNLKGVLTNGTPNCRWANLKPGETKGCTKVTYTVTAEDAATGTFTPFVEFRATEDRNGTK